MYVLENKIRYSIWQKGLDDDKTDEKEVDDLRELIE